MSSSPVNRKFTLPDGRVVRCVRYFEVNGCAEFRFRNGRVRFFGETETKQIIGGRFDSFVQ